jgi:hypothetical protein
MKIEVAREESPGWTATQSNLNSTTTFSNFQWDLQMTWQKSLAHIAIGAIATFWLRLPRRPDQRTGRERWLSLERWAPSRPESGAWLADIPARAR